jgi:VWFA-related protein
MRVSWLLLVGSLGLAASEEGVVFRSGVTLIRVDAQVVDRGNRAITSLEAEDFVLRENGTEQPIRNFSAERMPVDVLLLLDVSGSMRSHVERIAAASRQALAVLGEQDRVGIMVFDREARVRLPFRNNREEVAGELRTLIHHETFDGGTDITAALHEAARYVEREARPEARRAIVILTDDQTERGRDETAVSRSLARADVVLSALLVPDALRRRTLGGQWPGSGGPIGGPLGGIILGRRRGPVTIGSRTQSAGTEEIARRSGGDSLPAEDASPFETTLARIRQRYALHFHLPEGVAPGQERQIEVELASAARRRYPDADVRYRRVYMTPGGSAETIAAQIPPRVERGPERTPDSTETRQGGEAPAGESQSGGWRRVDEPRTGGWRKLEPGQEP